MSLWVAVVPQAKLKLCLTIPTKEDSQVVQLSNKTKFIGASFQGRFKKKKKIKKMSGRSDD